MGTRRQAYLDAMGIQTWAPRGGVASSETETLAPAAAESVETGPPTGLPIERLDWEALRAEVVACHRCSLAETRTQAVFGVGDPHADLLIVGEAPGADEDRLGEPFVGRAGQLLNLMLQAIGLKREQVYIANILKCRPPGNRDPHAEEAAHCRPFLLRQIALIQPKLILSVGRVSARNLLHSTDKVGCLRGRLHRFPETDTPLLVTYHPAYLLRSPEQKSKAWDDLQRVYRILHGRDE